MMTVWLKEESPLLDVCTMHDGKRYILLDRVLRAFTSLGAAAGPEAEARPRAKARPPEGTQVKLLVPLTQEQEAVLEQARAYLGEPTLSDGLKALVEVLDADGFFGGAP
jgi:hypothetical protein